VAIIINNRKKPQNIVMQRTFCLFPGTNFPDGGNRTAGKVYPAFKITGISLLQQQ
jgi:hypothetical protein